MPRRFAIFCFILFLASLGTARALRQQDPQEKPKKPDAPAPDDDVIKLDTNLILLNVTVTDLENHYVRGLKAEDFKVYEDLQPQKIQSFLFEESPFAGAILLDASGSMGGKLSFARAACASFVEGIRDGDVFSIYKFNGTKVKLLQDFTEVRDVPDSVWDMKADSLTPLYDAVVMASDALAKREERRRAIVLVSDGGDSNSRASMDEAVKKATNAGVSIFAVDLTDATIQRSGAKEMGAEAMKSLSEKTGGRFFRTPSGAVLKDSFAETVEELRNQYTLSYESTNDKQDGKWRKIEVRVTRPGLSIRAKQGYYAAKKKG